MTESTLSITYDDIQAAVGKYIGYEGAASTWDVAQKAVVDSYIQSGYRQFLYPPAIDGVEIGYSWSFLNPTTTITTIERYATGSIAVVSGTCTLTDGIWPSWAFTHGSLFLDGTQYTISSRDSNTQLTVVGSDIEVEEGDWYLKHAGYQDLPDLLGRVIGDFHFAADIHSASIPIISEHDIQMLLQQSVEEGRPEYAAIRSKSSDGTTGQRKEVVWWPIPDDAYTLTYRYEAFTGKLATTKYPLGGMKFSELIIESCLAIAEQMQNNQRGVHWESFIRLLGSSIAQDRRNGATIYGNMGRPSAEIYDPRDYRHLNRSSSITYNGEIL
jgi:hypothetical protein